jgi:hypothetical protein
MRLELQCLLVLVCLFQSFVTFLDDDGEDESGDGIGGPVPDCDPQDKKVVGE